MFTVFLFLLLVYINDYADTQDIQVLNSGIMRLKKTDMIVLFYVTIRHHGTKPVRVMVAMVECCERVTDEDTDCDLIDLYGGDFGIVEPGVVKNLTLVYPNLYGYNRRGSCLVNVLHRRLGNSESTEIHHRIEFDTTISGDIVPVVLNGWYDPETFISCDSPDLDPFDHCNPVDCRLKYSGYRNFYNRKGKMCQRVPKCVSDPNKELPDVAYVPSNNKCRNLENSVTRDDLITMTEEDLEVKTEEPQLVDIRCHHGEIDPKTGLCVCDHGWKSEVFDQDSYISGSSIYSMCTIRCAPEEEFKYVPPLAGLVLALWLFFCVLCCERHNCFGSSRRLAENCRPHAAAYFPVRGSNIGCSTRVASFVASTKTSFVASTKTSFEGFRHKQPSHFSMPFYQMSEKSFPKSFPGSAKSTPTFSSGNS